MCHLVNNPTLLIRQIPNDTNLVIDIENQAPQCVAMVSQKSVITLQGLAHDGSNARNLMDDEQQNSPRLVWHARQIIILELHDNAKMMFVEPGGHLDHAEPESVTK